MTCCLEQSASLGDGVGDHVGADGELVAEPAEVEPLTQADDFNLGPSDFRKVAGGESE